MGRRPEAQNCPSLFFTSRESESAAGTQHAKGTRRARGRRDRTRGGAGGARWGADQGQGGGAHPDCKAPGGEAARRSGPGVGAYRGRSRGQPGPGRTEAPEREPLGGAEGGDRGLGSGGADLDGAAPGAGARKGGRTGPVDPAAESCAAPLARRPDRRNPRNPSHAGAMETLLWFCNWSTLGVCAALKLPQISAVLGARSSRGISLPSLLLELAG